MSALKPRSIFHMALQSGHFKIGENYVSEYTAEGWLSHIKLPERTCYGKGTTKGDAQDMACAQALIARPYDHIKKQSVRYKFLQLGGQIAYDMVQQCVPPDPAKVNYRITLRYLERIWELEGRAPDYHSVSVALKTYMVEHDVIGTVRALRFHTNRANVD